MPPIRANTRAMLPAILVTLLGFLAYNITDLLFKFLQHHSALSIAVPAGFLTSALTLLVILFSKKTDALRPKVPWVFWLYGIGMALTFSCNAYALRTLTLAEFYVLVLITPAFITVAAAIFLKEKLRWPMVLSLMMGFAGVIVVMRPEFSSTLLPSLAVLLGTVSFGIRQLIARAAGKHEHPLSYALYGYLLMALICLPFLLREGIPNYSWHDGLLFVIFAVFSVLGMLGTLGGMQMAPQAGLVAPLHYVQILYGAALGYFFFGDVPQTHTLYGAALILLSGVVLYWPAQRRQTS